MTSGEESPTVASPEIVTVMGLTYDSPCYILESYCLGLSEGSRSYILRRLDKRNSINFKLASAENCSSLNTAHSRLRR
jgi:hypothetical protein